MPKPPKSKSAGHLVRVDDPTYRAIVSLQLEHLRRGGARLTLGAVIAKLVKDGDRR